MRMDRLLLVLLLALQGCSGSTPPAAQVAAADTPAPTASQDTSTAPPVADTAVPGGPRKACNLVTAGEMSSIIGSAVAATPHDETEGVTECSYSPVAATGPSVEFTISFGDGGSTLRAVAGMSKYDPNPGKAYAGIGDRADVLGPAIVIQTGEDLVSLTLVGVADQPAVAKKIFETAKSRL